MTIRKTMHRTKTLSLATAKRELAEVARIGQAFVDGDLCRKIYRPIGETFTNSDDIDFEPATCVPLKQTLMKLERLARIPCACALWRRRPDLPEVGEPTLFGSFASPMHIYRPASSGSTRKFEPPTMFAELSAAFEGRPACKITAGATAVAARKLWTTEPKKDRYYASPVLRDAGLRRQPDVLENGQVTLLHRPDHHDRPLRRRIPKTRLPGFQGAGLHHRGR